MKIKHSMLQYYMDIACRTAKLSVAKRAQVGGVLVSPSGNIISFGWNGTPSGFDNECEYLNIETNRLKTKPEVIHCEQNIYAKIAASSMTSENSVLFLTLSPCYDCAKLIIQAKTKVVVYYEKYRIDDPLKMLEQAKVKTYNFQEDFTNYNENDYIEIF